MSDCKCKCSSNTGINGIAATIDFREKAPLASSPTMFLDGKGELIRDSNHNSILSIGTPGTVAGLFLAHKKYGRLPWKDLLTPSIELAKNGVPLTWALYNESKWLKNGDNSFIDSYFNSLNGDPLKYLELWQQPSLANTLQQIANNGHDGFYKGVVADKIVEFMEVKGGIITHQDLLEYQAVERPPIVTTFNKFKIHSMPPPSSGGVTMAAMLHIMEQFDVKEIPFNSTAYAHLLIETMRRGFADRAEFLGDPDFNVDLPIERLLSKEHAINRAQQIDRKRASQSDPMRYGHPYDGKNTTHFSVIDNDGNAVSLTYTLEQSYGSKMGSKDLGFIFNNEMGDFNPVPGVTNTTGQIGSDPNLIEPGKRMLSSMNPTIVTLEGIPYLIVGSPGGRTIINTVYQTLLNSLWYDMNLHDAIEAVKLHHQWLPDTTYYEEYKLSPDTIKSLEQMGHHLQPVHQLGRLMGIEYDRENNIYIGVSDSSSPDGAAIGY